jgi:hypothetical protein
MIGYVSLLWISLDGAIWYQSILYGVKGLSFGGLEGKLTGRGSGFGYIHEIFTMVCLLQYSPFSFPIGSPFECFKPHQNPQHRQGKASAFKSGASKATTESQR